MKLLFDENLSPRLVDLLADLCPGSQSALLVGLGGQPDSAVWQYAVSHNLIVVSKDSDFVERAMMSRGDCKFVWLRLGNCTTQSAFLMLRNGLSRLKDFAESEDLVAELP